MGLFKRSKKEIPAELPDLTIDQENKAAESTDMLVSKPSMSQPIVKPQQQFPVERYMEVKKKVQEIDDSSNNDDDKGFFKELIGHLVQEQKNVDKMESFYNNRFASEDLVNQMRSYWEDQKPELLLKNVGSDLRAKMVEKTNELHRLEKEWQDIYFALLSKEEEIRSQEKDLKEIISEFITVCKRSLGKRSKK